jgi:hypothetical protein
VDLVVVKKENKSMSEEQVIELLAKQLAKTKGIKWEILCNNDTAEAISIKLAFIEQVKSLLFLCYPCTNPECQNGRVYSDFDDVDGRFSYVECNICHGTGLSDKKILAVLDKKQELPDNPYTNKETRICGEYDYTEVNKYEAHESCQTDMISQGWKKTVEDK